MSSLAKAPSEPKEKSAKSLTDIMDDNLSTKQAKDFLSNISPSIIKFEKDYYIVGNTYRRVIAIRGYPPTTTEQGLLAYFSERENITLKTFTHKLTALESDRLLEKATNAHYANMYTTEKAHEQIRAKSDVESLNAIMEKMHKNREDLVLCAVFIEMVGKDLPDLREIESEIFSFLKRSRINHDSLIAQQREGFLTVSPFGFNQFGNQFYRPLMQSAAANLYPFSYSGKTERGFYIGKDVRGTSIIIDFNARTRDRVNSNAIIMGMSGQGKSYLLKLILTNVFLSGKYITGLDPDGELEELAFNLGGSYLDLLDGRNKINVLEPKLFDDGKDELDTKNRLMLGDNGKVKPKLSQHISFLRAFFKSYKPEFTGEEIDTLGILLEQLYEQYGITNESDTSHFKPTDYPTLSDLYRFIEERKSQFTQIETNDEGLEALQKVATEEILRKILLGIHSMAVGDQRHYFDGHTNIKSDKFVMFGVKDLLKADENVKNAMLFNALSYMGDLLLTKGNTMMVADEFHTFLSNMIAITYITNYQKRVRKRDSEVLLATQNIEDFLHPNVAHLTKTLVSNPTHQFFFYPGPVDMAAVASFLQLEESEIKLISKPYQGRCLFRTGTERFHLEVIAPKHKSRLFGKAGGRGADS